LIDTGPIVACRNETDKLKLKDQHKTMNLVDRSFGRFLRNRLLSGCATRFTTRPFGCTLRRGLC
jgi:hypothetical protein